MIDGTVSIRLEDIEPSPGGRAKGFASYNPNAATWTDVHRVLKVYEDMRKADALPLGPRQCGYRLKERHVGQYDKSGFDRIGEIVKRLCQDRRLQFENVADAASVDSDPGGYDSLEEFVEYLPAMFDLDRRLGQPTVIETYAEARETLPLIERLAHERGVRVYSGGGSKGPNLAYKVAMRAVERAVYSGQSTHILGICDFDKAGISNILRPHIEHVREFLYGRMCIEVGGPRLKDRRGIADTDCEVTFEHLALTPEMALQLVQPDERSKVLAYMHSGSDLWSRDHKLLEGVQKVETEALDPVDLRNLVMQTLDTRLDQSQLEAIAKEEAEGRELLEGIDIDAITGN